MPSDPTTLDAVAQAELVRRGEVSAEELVVAAIAAAERWNPVINAIVHPRFERALEEARAGLSGPFAGVPVVIKDLAGRQRDEPYHAGTRALQRLGHRAAYDSSTIRRLRTAGFVAIGRTNVPELGSTVTTEPVSYGATRNPWDLGRSAGGSSGGSAAAVAAGIVPVGHASDGGGSIRVPASECALVGLKPSRGRVSQGPDVGESWAGYSTQGALTRTVRDAAAVLDVLAGDEPGDPYVAPALARPLAAEVGGEPGRLRIGFVDRSPHTPIDADGAMAVRRTADALAGLGHDVEPGAPPALFDPEVVDRFVGVICANTLVDIRGIEALLGRAATEDDLEADNLFYGTLGGSLSAADYIQLLQAQQRWSRDIARWWRPPDSRGFDLLLSPTIATPPPPLGYLAGAAGAVRIREVLQFTAQFNITGQPAVSLPMHRTAAGLPVGVQLVAAYGREDVLIRVAAQLEGARPWCALPPLP